MYYFTADTIAEANKRLENLDAKVGGLLCVLQCLTENIEDNVNYTINGELLRRQLSFVFDKEPKDTFDYAKASYIVFAKEWHKTFFNTVIREKVDLLSCAVFFLRREGFEKELTKEEIIDLFIKRFNLRNYRDSWFFDGSNLVLEYNQGNVEQNQIEFYHKRQYGTNFKSILFNGVIQKSAADIKAAGQVQTLYSGSGVQKCFLLSDEPLDQYYVMNSAGKVQQLVVKEEEESSLAYIGAQLKDMYNNAGEGRQVASIIICGIKYGKVIKDNDYKASAIVAAAGLQESYSAELTKGIKIYECLADNEFDIRFAEPLSYCELNYHTGLKSKFPPNRIMFGAPGTGKSHTLENDRIKLLKNESVGGYERVTFHPDYTYAQFVGTYKPVTDKKGNISYRFVPGPFMRVYVEALKNARTDNPQPYILLIEEINRANVAAVFGDVFQLLDRDAANVSEYPVHATEDVRNYLASQLGGTPDNYIEIRIPDNMFIWATMNSADQGVFPMDTAFKRRWDFTYLGIDNDEDKIAKITVTLGKGEHMRTVKWNELRKAINAVLLNDCKVNEDKLMGPFFIGMKNLSEDDDFNENFCRIFKNKVIMYLFDDAAKQKRPTLFDGCNIKNLYSAICEEFDEKGVDIFGESVRSIFPISVNEDEEA